MASFDDFDACAEALKGWDIEVTHLERGGFRGELQVYQSEATLLNEARFSIKLHQRGEPPRGFRTIVVPGDARQRIAWRGHEVHGSQVMLFPDGSELDAVSQSSFHVFAFSFSQEQASELGQVLYGADYPALLAEREVMECTSRTLERLRGLASACFRQSAHTETAGEALLEALVEALAEEETGRGPAPQRARALAVRRCLELVEADEHRPVRVSELCRVARVSRRTLEYAFQERFDVSPQSYMLSRRLAGVRRDLVRGAGYVGETAINWGFSHMSQFSALYRREFGELPSETLRKMPGRG